MGSFCDSPMSDCFQQDGKIPEGSPGTYNNAKVPPQSEYARTPSPNAVKEKFFEEAMPKPSGENDQF